jgi:N4-(beta-N-acetylglucosaminyl)-L-asparaginase
MPQVRASGKGGPIAISSGNGLRATTRALQMMRESRDPLVAAVSGVNIIEADPEDVTVGYGGLPNEDGIVELDASVMHGPTGRGGAVAALRDVKHPSLVALRVLERTDHVLLVGEGARRFAVAHGFPIENLLTEKARRIWLDWKERRSDQDDWIAPSETSFPPLDHRGGTVHCSALDAEGNLGAVTSTSGLAFKIPGRVGDSPIIGAGLFVDNEVGSCGATGRGEAVILTAGSASVVDEMRKGASPKEACLEVLRRMARNTRDKRLLREDGTPAYNVTLYALRKDGEYAGATLVGQNQFAVSDERGNRLENCVAVYPG